MGKTKIKIISFIISFSWIGLGTLMQISSYPTYNFLEFDYNSFVFNLLYYITFPFNIILFVFLFADKLSNIYVIVIILQLLQVFFYWWIVYKFLKRIVKSERSENLD